MRDYGLTNAAPYASAPAVGAAGDSYWNTTTKTLYVSDGTAWIATGPVAASGVTPGTYGSTTRIARITINAEGRITAVSEVKPTAFWG